MNMKRTDVLMIVSVISVLLLLGLVAMRQLQRNSAKSARISCVGNLKQVGLSFRVWANDHGDLYPTSHKLEDPTLRSEVLAGRMFRVFQLLSNELAAPKTISCPADNRWAWVEWSALTNTNISYLLGVDAADDTPNSILSGDRNIALEGRLLSGVVALGNNSQVTWTRAIHKNFGNLALADGSVSGSMQTDPEQLRRHLRDSGDATNLVVFPQ
jgi:hypothetical protein